MKIYPWYDKARWFAERYTGDQSEGSALVVSTCPPPAVAHFRHSYASFRVHGLEYARLEPNGRLRYGTRRAPLKPSCISPPELVRSLEEMFRILAANSGDPRPAECWADQEFDGEVAAFLAHVARHHQAEHWLESKILSAPHVLGDGIAQARSQVAMCYQGDRPAARRFIDLLALDRSKRLMWVVELKVPKAGAKAVAQGKRYADWVKLNLGQLLDPSNGYFADARGTAGYEVGLMLVAPTFSGNIGKDIRRCAGAYPVAIVHVNQGWRRALRVTAVETPYEEQPMQPYYGRWADDELTCRLVQIAREEGLFVRDEPDPPKLDYVNIHKESVNGNVGAQIHKHERRGGGRALVVREEDPGCRAGEFLERIENYEDLSGNKTPNKGWLSATGDNYGRLPPAKAFWVPNSLLGDTDRQAAWRAIRCLFKFLARNKDCSE